MREEQTRNYYIQKYLMFEEKRKCFVERRDVRLFEREIRLWNVWWLMKNLSNLEEVN